MSVEIRGDVSKNILYIILKGFFSDEEVKNAVVKLKSEANKMKPGFHVINDVSEFKPASVSATEEIKKAQEYIKAKGVNRVIRVVKGSSIGAMQMGRISKQVGYTADAAESIEEAEEMLK